MYLCCPTDDLNALYVFIDKDDTAPYIFRVKPTFPKSAATKWVEIEEDRSDDEEYRDPDEVDLQEIEVHMIPTNAYKIIEFRSSREKEKFDKLIAKYYDKEIK